MDMIQFKKGMEVYQVPIRYWEDEWPITKLTVTESCGMDDQCVYARDPKEDQSMYYSRRNRVYYTRENAERARQLLTELHELENEDGAKVWVDITLASIEEKP